MTLITPRKLGVLAAMFAGAAVLYLVGGNLVTWQPDARANFWALVLAALAAFWYGWLTHQIRRAEHTPILTAVYRDNRTVIRNNGKGAALNGTLTNDKGGSLLMLGDIPPAAEREFTQNVGWSLVESHYLFYQDVFGRWYATKSLASILVNAANCPITNAFQGRVFNPPPDAARHADTRSAFEYMLQLGRWWSPQNWYRRVQGYSRKRWIAYRIMRAARRAVDNGSLPEPFSANEFAQTVDWPRIVADRFITSHLVGNQDNEREYFSPSDKPDRFKFNRKVRP